MRETGSTARSRQDRRHGLDAELTDHLEVSGARSPRSGSCLLLTPAVGRAARHLRLVDRPRRRRARAHGEIPRLGGLALFLGIFVPSLAFLPLGGELRGVLLGAGVATTVGAVDDFRGLAWWQKLGGQVAAAAIPTGFGVWVQQLHVPDRRHPPGCRPGSACR